MQPAPAPKVKVFQIAYALTNPKVGVGFNSYLSVDTNQPMMVAQYITPSEDEDQPVNTGDFVNMCPGVNAVQGFSITWDGKTVDSGAGLQVLHDGSPVVAIDTKSTELLFSDLPNEGKQLACQAKQPTTPVATPKKWSWTMIAIIILIIAAILIGGYLYYRRA